MTFAGLFEPLPKISPPFLVAFETLVMFEPRLQDSLNLIETLFFAHNTKPSVFLRPELLPRETATKIFKHLYHVVAFNV